MIVSQMDRWNKLRYLLQTARALISVFSLRAGSTNTEAERSRERYRRIALTTLTSASAKGVTLLTMIVSVPLTIRYLGTERYALWMVITSSVSMLVFSDLGIGNGLLNAIAESHGKNDEKAAHAYVSSAFFLLLGVCSTLFLVLAGIYHIVPWARIFNVTAPLAVLESAPASAVFIGCFAIGLPMGIVQRIENGYQDGFTNNLWTMLGGVFGLAGLLLAVHLRAGLPWLVVAITGAPLVATLWNGIFLFSWLRPNLRPSWAAANRKYMLDLLSKGMYFFILQFCVVTVTSADNLIVSQLLGPTAVTTYAVVMRMFTIIPAILLMVLIPLWPAYGESIARGEIDWARRALARSLKMILSATLASGIVLVTLGPWILRHWVGRPLPGASRALLLGMAVWAMLSTAGHAISIFLNGANRMGVQVLSGVLTLCSAVFMKFTLAPRLGLSAVIWSTDFAYVLFVCIPAILFMPRFLTRLQSAAGACKLAAGPGAFAEQDANPF